MVDLTGFPKGVTVVALGDIGFAYVLESSLPGALGELGAVVYVVVSGGLRSGGATRGGGRGQVGMTMTKIMAEDDSTEQ